MTKVYLFDWGDTLMLDDPDALGKMCDWEIVEAIDGAAETLKVLSKSSQIYIATGAADSTEFEVKQAFERVGLTQFISGYFCKANLGVAKGTAEFFKAILTKLDLKPNEVTMVGDNFDKDIKPALALGIQTYWLTDIYVQSIPVKVNIIKHLSELTINKC